jgi:hypothetical protein
MGKILLLAAVFVLTACATQVTAVTDRTVVVRAGFPDMGIEKALLLADQECMKKGLSARTQQVTSPSSDRYIFECVK